MNYEDPEEIMDEISNVVPFYGKVNHWKLDNNHHQHQSGMEELSSEKKIRLSPARNLSDLENKNKVNNIKLNDNTFILTTGRILFHFRTGFMNPQVEALNNFIEDPYIEIDEADAEKLELENEERVKIETPYGEIEAESRITDRLNKGTVFVPLQFLPFHFTENTYEFSGEKENPIISYPEYRVSTCIIEKMYSG
ncbi:MAG: molybdopterin dinucleotide binding domain-containing protein [Bacillota bacterium]